MKKAEFIKRREAFAKEMKSDSFALLNSGKAAHKTRDQYYPFTISKNFYYLTGLKRQNFILLILNEKDSHFEFLFIEEPSEFAAKWIGSRMTKEEANEVSGIPVSNIFYLKDFDSFVANRVLLDSRQAITKIPRNLYLDMYRQYTMAKPAALTTFAKIISSYPELSIIDACEILDDLRRIKTNSEIAEIQKAIGYTYSGIKAMMKNIQPGKNEREQEALFEFEIKKAGSEGLSFDTICAGGKNATVLHYVDNNTVIDDNVLVLNDLGALSNEYAADITRTYPSNGKFTKRQKEFYQIVLDVNKAIIKAIKPGIYMSELNELANNLLAEGLIKLGKIKDKTELHKYYYHSIGHYLGLDVHDVGTYKKPLEPGVVVTVEPGLYIDDEGIGIRVEDDVLVTKDGSVNLSQEIIKEIEDIEDFMKK